MCLTPCETACVSVCVCTYFLSAPLHCSLYRMTKLTDEHGDKQDGDAASALWVLWLGPCCYANPPGSNLQQDSGASLSYRVQEYLLCPLQREKGREDNPECGQELFHNSDSRDTAKIYT